MTLGRHPGSAQIMTRPNELGEPDGHADRRQDKAPLVAEPGGEPADENRTDERTQVDAHVEGGKPGVAPRAAFRVERRDHGAAVGLEQPDADRDHQQSEEEQLRLPEGEHEVAGDDEQRTTDHGAL